MPARTEQYRKVLTRIQRFCQENQQILGNPSYITLFDYMVDVETDYHNIYGLMKENGEMVFCYSEMQGGRGKRAIKINLEGFACTLCGIGISDTTINPQLINENFLEGIKRFVREGQIRQSNIEGLVNLRLFWIKQDLMNSKEL